VIEEVQPRIYRIPSVLGPRRFAQWLVVGDERLLLVDSGIDGTIEEHVAPALRELGRRPDELTDVVVSHADVDHYGGNSALRRLAPRARIVAHELDRPLIESWRTAAEERYGWYRRHGLDYDEATWQWLENAAGPDTPIDGTVEPGEALDLGGITVTGDGTVLRAEPEAGRAIRFDGLDARAVNALAGFVTRRQRELLAEIAL
jgi:glyoxylase-like metal-dependent hydrolase (beta-lactamase superfamily II)